MLPRLLLLVGLVLAAQPAWAQDEPGRVTLYSCDLGPDADAGFLSLSGVEGDGADGFTALQFTAEMAGEAAITVPAVPSPDGRDFLFSNSDGPEGYLVSIRFTDGKTRYRLYSLAIPPDPDDENDMGGAGGGLVVTTADGATHELSCGETPYEFISYMAGAMGCDADPRYGANYCDPDDPPERVPGDGVP